MNNPSTGGGRPLASGAGGTSQTDNKGNVSSSTTAPTGTTSGTGGDKKLDDNSSSTAQMDASERSTSTTTRGVASNTKKDTPSVEPTDQAVLEYLKKRGMGSAVLELNELLKKTDQDKDKDSNDTKTSKDNKSTDQKKTEQNKSSEPTSSTERMAALKQQMEHDDNVARNQRSVLTKSTGGGFGYDRDAAAPVVQWGVPDDAPSKLAVEGGKSSSSHPLGVEEARAYLDAFCALQLWILSLPDDPSAGSHIQPRTNNVIQRAQELLKSDAKVSLTSFVRQIANPSSTASSTTDGNTSETNTNTNYSYDRRDTFQLPPSAKPELLAVSFALLVHTYCELLEVGMESTAHVLRDAFQPIYDPLYGSEFRDLFHCTTTDDIIRLNTHNSQHMEALANLKSILVQVASFQLKKEELSQTQINDVSAQNRAKRGLQEYDQNITLLQQKYNDLSQRASAAFDRMHDLPFLRRARAVRWQLSLSTTTFGLLSSFLNTGTAQHSSLLAMSTLLQTKCELHVERRDPLPFTPACVLDDDEYASGDKATKKRQSVSELNESAMVNWAAPVPRRRNKNDPLDGNDLPFPKFHLDEEYDDEKSAERDKRLVEFNRAILVNGFRRLEALERKREYQVMARSTFTGEGGTTESKSRTIANPLEPSILLSTLCANSNSATKKRSASSGSGNSSSNKGSDGTTITPTPIADASAIWEESGIGLCCAKVSPPDGRRVAVGCDDSAIRIWNLMDGMGPDGSMGEPAQVLFGHKNGFPVFDVDWNRDGRSLLSAGGDGSVRLWDTMAQGPFGQVAKPPSTKEKTSAGGMTSTTLTSSAGAGGTATGNTSTPTTTTPSGSTKKTSTSSSGGTGGGSGAGAGSSSSTSGNITNAAAKDMLEKATAALEKAKASPDMNVPGLRPEMTPYQSGAALAIYRGHAPSTPVWSVAFAPCGYYFASAGADATARLWTTDRASPVRLFVGHTSDSVNTVVFHPNCNYVLTGSEDRTARLWDIQTGRTVRILNGCRAGVNVVKVSPCGKYAAGADYSGIVHLWDMGSGKKVTEFLPKKGSGGSSSNTTIGNTISRDSHTQSNNNTTTNNTTNNTNTNSNSNNIHNLSMINSLSFSTCGTALAVGGDDCCVRVWDIRKSTIEEREEPKVPIIDTPTKIFPTRRTLIMNVHFTKRNLLLSVGKFATPVPGT